MQKLTILKLKVFLSNENSEKFVVRITTLFHSAENFVGYPACIPNFLNFAAVFLFKVIFCEYLDLWYFILSAPIF